MTYFLCGTFQWKKFPFFLTSLTLSTPRSKQFTGEMSFERAAILDTEVFKGPRLLTLKILHSQTHSKPTEYTLSFSSCHLFNTKKGFIKGEALRLLITNSVKESKYSVREAIPHLSFVKSWLKFSSSTEQKLFAANKKGERNLTVCYHLQPGYTES